MFAAIGLAWKLNGFGGVMKLIPRWVWFSLAAILIVIAGIWWHGHQVKVALAAAEERGEQRILAAVARKATAIKAKGDKAALDIKDEANAEIRRSADVADSIRLHGRGKAYCPRAAIGSPGGYVRAAPGSEAPVAPVPGGEGPRLITLPFSEVVTVFEDHDRLLSEDKAWRKNEIVQTEIVEQESK